MDLVSTLNGYLFDAAIGITSVVPSSGPEDGGTVVTMGGWGFDLYSGLACRFGRETGSGSEATLASSSLILCTSPKHRFGLFSVDLVSLDFLIARFLTNVLALLFLQGLLELKDFLL